MPLFALGLSHRTAPAAVREALAFPAETRADALRSLASECGAGEAVLLVTCNRTEIYIGGADDAILERAARWLERRATRRVDAFASHLYCHRGEEEVARHAFRVACGLDSMVIGEPQILGQLKSAIQDAAAAGTLGGHLDRLFQQAFGVAKEVRARTEIGEASVSMAAAALKLARQLFGDLGATKVLLVGAGEMIEQAAVYFAAQSPRELVVANRTVERGEALAQRFNARAIALAELPARFHEFDVIVSCTASTLPLIGKGMVERALKARHHKPVFIVDLAMPRDVEPEVGELRDVFLQTLDSLAEITQRNTRKREDAVRQADAIVATRVAQFAEWVAARAMVPTIRRLRAAAETLREIELARARKRLAGGDDPLEVLEALSHGLLAKLLHRPMRALNAAGAAEGDALAGAAARLFLDEDATRSRPGAIARL